MTDKDTPNDGDEDKPVEGEIVDESEAAADAVTPPNFQIYIDAVKEILPVLTSGYDNIVESNLKLHRSTVQFVLTMFGCGMLIVFAFLAYMLYADFKVALPFVQPMLVNVLIFGAGFLGGLSFRSKSE